MPLERMEHFLLQTDDRDATRRWYTDILGLEEGPAPDFGFPACWLYPKGVPVLHLSTGALR